MKKYIIFLLTCIFLISSCKKEWLSEKSDKSLIVPTTLTDLQAILDYYPVMNSADVSLGQIGGDDYYLRPANYEGAFTFEQNAYRWLPEIFTDENVVDDWKNAYSTVLYANLALEGLSKVEYTATNATKWNNIKGSALFYRSWSFFQLAQLFTKPYNPTTASSDPGIPLRINSNVNIRYDRGTVKDVYQQLVGDLVVALPLLPTETSIGLYRPSKQAAYAFLARIYLSMSDYENALLYADSSAMIYNDILDFNTVDPTLESPLTFNSEVLFMDQSGTYTHFFGARVDSTLYQSFENNDLRKQVFFNVLATGVRFKGSYYYYPFLFTGLATDEVVLIIAESNARRGNTAAAMDALNRLLEKRWVTGTFGPLTAVDAEDALSQILNERKKELLFRGLRWSDLRRINADSRFEKTLTRDINGQIYTLLPNDVKYTYPLPPDEVLYNDLQQNPR
jgi:tetratricopeptide (TPR) repeat protein